MPSPSSRGTAEAPTNVTTPDPRLPPLTGWLRPAVDAAARLRWSIHRKLLAGFLTGAILLVGMAILSLVVIGQMNERMTVVLAQADKVDYAQQMLYDVTAQSHYRAMALLTYHDDPQEAATWNDKVGSKKADFARLLGILERTDPEEGAFYRRLNAANADYSRAGTQVLEAFGSGHVALAEERHLKQEHPASHVLEDLLANCSLPNTTPCFPELGAPFIRVAQQAMEQATVDFQSDQRLLRTIVLAFSAVSVAVALMLGFLLSWSFLLPLKKMEATLGEMSAGNLGCRMQVQNRDEFGNLAADLNATSMRLEESFENQQNLADRLRETNQSLARASEAKSRFLASVSHELRTPMNAILGFTDALLAGVDGPLNDDQRESLGWVQRGGRDLLGLINEILDLSKIEAGRLTLEIEPFALPELLESVVAQHRSLAAQKGIALNWHDAGAPAVVVLDRQRLRQTLVNLIGNAAKFTREGQVDVEAGSVGEGAFYVSVRDTGPGIDPSEQEAIFEEFRQVEGDGSGAGTGTGLGLAIARRLSRAMGGDVTVDSVPGKGATFRVLLPVDCRSPKEGAVQGQPVSNGAGERLLLSVDDDPSVAPLLSKMLADSGYRVVPAQSPATAVSDARRLHPAGILLDLLMQERAGEDVLRELKSDSSTKDIPVIVLSVVDAADGPALADGHLSKPVDKAALTDVLARLGLAAVVP
jgi:signal transduction histidine kinase/CheY-like chemotaxis protein